MSADSNAGEQLRRVRERLDLSLRDVEIAASRLAERYHNPEFEMPASRLSDIESKGMLPNIYRLYTLAAVYRKDVRELLQFFGIATANFFEDAAATGSQKKTHLVPSAPIELQARIPVAMDAPFNPRITTNIGRFIRNWGTVPLQLLSEFENANLAYGYAGTEDYTMSPLILPGSLFQIDTSLTAMEEGPWSSEYERPIYFFESRDEYHCSWGSAGRGSITLEPHPLSGVKPRTFRHPQEIEVVGRVTGIAMRLDAAKRSGSERSREVSSIRTGNVARPARS